MIDNIYFIVLCCIVLYNLFNDADSNLEYTALKGRINKKLE
jgi:hypothetical protein